NGRLVFSAAICPGGDRGGGQLDIGDRHLPRHHELDYDSNSRRSFASAALPSPDISFAGAEPLCDGALLDPKRVERPAEVACLCARGHNTLRWWVPPARLTRQGLTTFNGSGGTRDQGREQDSANFSRARLGGAPPPGHSTQQLFNQRTVRARHARTGPNPKAIESKPWPRLL